MTDPPDLDDRDLALAGGTTRTKVAGLFIAMTGVVSVVVAVQVLTSVRILSWVRWLPPGMIALGAVVTVLGGGITRARDTAASMGLVLVPLLAILDAVWLYVSFRGGFYSLMCLFSVPFGLASSALVIAALGDCERASEARRNLAKSGLDLGL